MKKKEFNANTIKEFNELKEQIKQEKKRFNVFIFPHHVQMAKELGDNMVSRGVRNALEWCYSQEQKRKARSKKKK